MVHNYNDNLIEQKDKRSMEELNLIGFREQHLHSVQDYMNA